MAILIEKKPRLPLKKPKGFIELMARTNFSFLQGASHPEEMVEQAILHDYHGIGICDLNGLYGVARGFQTMNSPSLFAASLKAKDEFKYLLGAELTLTDETHLTLVPKNRKGYAHLCELLTLGKRQASKGFSKLSLEQVAENPDDLLAFAIPPWSLERYDSLFSIFGDRLYLPIWRDLTWESQEFCEQAFQLERHREARLFVSQRPFMHSPERKSLFDILTCIHHHTTLTEAKNILSQNAERYLRPLDDLAWLWQDRIDLLEHTLEIAGRVDFSLSEIRYRYPESQLPEGQTKSRHLKKLVEDGLQNRFCHTPQQRAPDKVVAMAYHELGLIAELEYEDYFLTLYEICQFARERKILFQGRGSAANSVVCFALGLTAVDPTKIDLLFERFISKERGEPPDIDIDFEHSRREEVIQYIYEKYDEHHAAMVCTVIRFKSRMAIRETAKVFGIPLKVVNAIIKYTGRDGIKRLLATDPESLAARARFSVPEQIWPLFLQMSDQLRGFPRHLGIHTGGFLITHERITELVPVEKATMNGRYVIQWNKDDVNTLKLMKIDFLSLGMLTALRKCLHLLKEHRGLDWDLSQIPPEDEKTYDMICEADTVGVFQIESRAQMNTLPRLRPRNFYDLVVEVALVRPGPLQGGMVHPYLKRRQGLEKVIYPHEDLVPVLEKTKGVPIFQEQVMRIVVVAAGFSPGEADELRRIMSMAWRKKGTMDGIRNRVINGLLKHGLTQVYADQVYKTIEGFANYGFPESHAASFALLTYASSFIKCHYPEIFACALLNSQPMGFYAPRSLIADAQRHGVKVLALDINHSEYDYTLENHRDLRVGLCSLHGMPEKLLHSILENRQRQGPFRQLEELIQRTRLPRPMLMKLAASGALQSFGYSPRDLLWRVESLSLDPNSFQWGNPKESTESSESQELIPFESNWEALQREYQSKGFSVDNHPLSVMRPWLMQKSEALIANRYVPYFSSQELPGIKHKNKVRIAGLVGVTQRPPTAKGMCFITLEDEFGFINVVIPPDIYQRDRMTIYTRSLLEIQGSLERSGPITNVKADRVLPLQ
jgi:DNA-directed DNA polymerase III PolC